MMTINQQRMIKVKNLSDTFTLTNDYEIPILGYGTWQVTNPEECVEGVINAVKSGYRHIDTAQMYGNEEYVGEGIRQSGVPREELFVTTKINNTSHGYDAVRKSTEESLEKLGLDYLDLVLIHWPVVKSANGDWQKDDIDTWRALEDLYEEGKLKAIGISNFAVKHLENIVANCSVVPMVNQIKLFPGVLQEDTVELSRKHNMVIEAYSPLAPIKELSEDEKVQAMCEKYDKTVAQLLLRFSLQHEFLPLTKSVHEDRIKENADIFDFEITAEDMSYLDNLSFENFSKPDDDKAR